MHTICENKKLTPNQCKLVKPIIFTAINSLKLIKNPYQNRTTEFEAVLPKSLEQRFAKNASNKNIFFYHKTGEPYDCAVERLKVDKLCEDQNYFIHTLLECVCELNRFHTFEKISEACAIELDINKNESSLLYDYYKNRLLCQKLHELINEIQIELSNIVISPEQLDVYTRAYILLDKI